MKSSSKPVNTLDTNFVHCRDLEGGLAAHVQLLVSGLRVRVVILGLHLDLHLWHRTRHASGDGHRGRRRARDLQVQGDAAQWQGPVMRGRMR